MSEPGSVGTEGAASPHVLQKRVRKWSIPKPGPAIMVCVSSRALFDMTGAQKIYEENGLKRYIEYILDHEDEPLSPGGAFPFVRSLNYVNERLIDLNPKEEQLFDVVLMSNNSAQIGVALINAINYHNLTVERICLTAGNSVIGYLESYDTDLYLSADNDAVLQALRQGIAAATLSPISKTEASHLQLRVAFDGDAVLFSDEAEVIAKSQGLDKFLEHEYKLADVPLQMGPLRKFAMTLGKMKKKFHDKGFIQDCPIRTYLVTARSGGSAGKRALITLREWGLDIDEALFLAGAPKGPILKKIQPHLFFDDQRNNVESGQQYGVPSAHVPYGIAQESHCGCD